MYLELPLKDLTKKVMATWSKEPFRPFEKKTKTTEVFGEGDFYKSDCLEKLLSEKFEIDGRYIYLSITSEKVTIYVDKSGFVKPYIRIENETLYVTTQPEQVYSAANRFSHKGIECFLELGYVPPPYCLFHNWKVIPPGFRAEISRNTLSIQFKQWWFLKKQTQKYDHQSFWDCFNEEISSLQENETFTPSILLSGGIDSRLISSAIKGSKKTFFMKMEGFSPDEADGLTISQYDKNMLGDHKQILINLDSQTVSNSFIESTFIGIDHAHMGRWKFHLFLKQIADDINDGVVLNGQTADTILMKNITGDNITSRLTRALYSRHSNALNIPLVNKIFFLFSKILPEGKSQKIQQILKSWGTPEYITGYLLNPGFIPGKRKEPGVVDSVLRSISEELIASYDSDIDSIMTDFLLRTFIWGMDMRGIEDSSKAFNIKMRFVFMQGKIMNMLMNIPHLLNPQTGKYKQFFQVLMKKFVTLNPVNTPYQVEKITTYSNLEEKLSTTDLGNTFKTILSSKEFLHFLEMINDMTKRKDLDLHSFHYSDEFIYQQRLISLFLISKFMQGEKPCQLIEKYTQTASRFGNLTRKYPDFKPGEADAETAQPE